jgi:hypothetical protein
MKKLPFLTLITSLCLLIWATAVGSHTHEIKKITSDNDNQSTKTELTCIQESIPNSLANTGNPNRKTSFEHKTNPSEKSNSRGFIYLDCDFAKSNSKILERLYTYFSQKVIFENSLKTFSQNRLCILFCNWLK